MKVYLDENYSEYLAFALNELEKPFGEIEVISTKIKMKHWSDEDLMRHIASEKAVLFTKDKDFHKQGVLRELVVENNVGLVYFGMKGQNNWGIVRYVIYNWAQLREKIIKKKKAFAYKIMSDGQGKSKIEKIDNFK